MKKLIKVLVCLIILISIFSFAFIPRTYALDSMMRSADEFLTYGEDNAVDQAALAETSKNLYYPFLAVAIVLAVIVGAYLGIKIMVATVEEKAKIKQMLMPYVVGVVVIFSVFFIWKTVVHIGTSAVGEGRYNPSTADHTGPIGGD